MKNLKHWTKRSLALFLALVMCLGMIQMSAFADDSTTALETEQPEVTAEVTIGDKTGEDAGLEKEGDSEEDAGLEEEGGSEENAILEEESGSGFGSGGTGSETTYTLSYTWGRENSPATFKPKDVTLPEKQSYAAGTEVAVFDGLPIGAIYWREGRWNGTQEELLAHIDDLFYESYRDPNKENMDPVEHVNLRMGIKTFAGWSTRYPASSATMVGTSIIMDEDKTLIAAWNTFGTGLSTPIEVYTVKWVSGYGSNEVLETTTGVKDSSGNLVYSPYSGTTPTRTDGYTFTAWGTPEVNEETKTCTITAQWTKEQPPAILVIWKSGGEDNVTLKADNVPEENITRENGKVTEVKATYPDEPTRDGYQFDGWTIEEQPDKSIVITAQWRVKGSEPEPDAGKDVNIYVHFVPDKDKGQTTEPKLSDIKNTYAMTYSYTANGKTVTGKLTYKDAVKIDPYDQNHGLDEEKFHEDVALKWTIKVPVLGNGTPITVYFTQENYDLEGFVRTGVTPALTFDGKQQMVNAFYANESHHLYNRYSVGNAPTGEPIEVVKTASKTTCNVGDTIIYTIEVRNNTTKGVSVKVKDVLPDGLEYVSCNYNGQYDKATNTVDWTPGTKTFYVAPAKADGTPGKTTFKVTVKVTKAGEITNTATVTLDGKTYTGSNTVTVKDPVTVTFVDGYNNQEIPNSKITDWEKGKEVPETSYPARPVHNDKDPDGWKVETDLTTGNITITALWKDKAPEKVTVTYKDGDTEIGKDTPNKGDEYEVKGLPDDVTPPDGKEFDKWQGSDGNVYTPGDKITPDGDLTLTVVWKDKSTEPTPPSGGGGGGSTVTRYDLTIHYVYEDGTQAAPDHTERVRRGSSYSVDSPAIEGYTPNRDVVTGRMNGDVTVTVTYTANPVEIPEEDPPLTEDPNVPDEPTVPDEPPVVDIPEEAPPLVDIPEEDPPLVDIPEEDPPLVDEPSVDIPEENPPLTDAPVVSIPDSDVPQTGEASTALWLAAALLAGAGLVYLNTGKRKEQ